VHDLPYGTNTRAVAVTQPGARAFAESGALAQSGAGAIAGSGSPPPPFRRIRLDRFDRGIG
jgi:hypothetical protein